MLRGRRGHRRRGQRQHLGHAGRGRARQGGGSDRGRQVESTAAACSAHGARVGKAAHVKGGAAHSSLRRPNCTGGDVSGGGGHGVPGLLRPPAHPAQPVPPQVAVPALEVRGGEASPGLRRACSSALAPEPAVPLACVKSGELHVLECAWTGRFGRSSVLKRSAMSAAPSAPAACAGLLTRCANTRTTSGGWRRPRRRQQPRSEAPGLYQESRCTFCFLAACLACSLCFMPLPQHLQLNSRRGLMPRLSFSFPLRPVVARWWQSAGAM